MNCMLIAYVCLCGGGSGAEETEKDRNCLRVFSAFGGKRQKKKAANVIQ